MKQALILVDIQNDYFPGGKFELKNILPTVENVKSVLEYFRCNSYPVIYIKHIALKEDAPFFVKNSTGADIYKDIAPNDNEYVVEKNYPNSFFKTNLMDILKKENVEHIVICGMMSHLCIDSTVRGGFELGLNCTLISDCCTTRDLTYNNNKVSFENVHNSFMSALATFSKVTTTKDFLSS